MSIFTLKSFDFPYSDLKFPGQHTEERILFITREGQIVLYLKELALIIVGVVGLILGSMLLGKIELFEHTFTWLIPLFIPSWIAISLFVAWWIYIVWLKTLFIITTRRLTKFIYTTPWSRYQMSLGHDHIVDTGAYQKGWFQLLTGLGYFVARSSAGAVKNFKIINISFSEDLHNYINKLLYIFNEKKGQLDYFRPFIPHLKGDARDEYVRRVAPRYSKAVKQVEELGAGDTQYLPPKS